MKKRSVFVFSIIMTTVMSAQTVSAGFFSATLKKLERFGVAADDFTGSLSLKAIDNLDYTKMQEYEYDNGNRVYGYIGDNGIYGYGMAVYNDGDSYEGFFENGKRNYWGIYNLGNGDMLIGSDNNGVLEGMGLYVFEDQSILIANYDDGKVNGDGLMFDTEESELYLARWEDEELVDVYEYDRWDGGDGIRYIGSNVNGKIEGLGMYVNSETSQIYVGEFKNGKPNGFGMCIFDDNSWKIGTYSDGEVNGYFTYIDDDGSKLMGSMMNGNYKGYLAYYESNVMLILNGEGNVIGSIEKN